MLDQDKSKQELIEELAEMRQRTAALEAADRRYRTIIDAVPLAIGPVTGVADVTEQKRAEAASRESEERFRKVFEQGPMGILLVGTDGRIQHTNPHFCDMLGYAENEIIALGLTGISHPDDWKRDHGFVSRLWQGEISHYHSEKRYFRKDGQVVWGELTVSLMRDEAGRPINTIGMVKNITIRKQAQEALQKAHDELEQRVEERTAELAKANADLDVFRRFIDASGVGFGMADLDGTIAYANPFLCRLMGEEKLEDVVGKNISAYYTEEYLHKRRAEMLPALLREENWHVETKVLPRNGEPISIQQSSFLILDEDGNPLRTGVVITDITERKRAEEALRASEERFRVAFEEAPVGMVIGEGNGILTKVNSAVCRMTGYREEELIGRNVRDLTYPEDRELSGPFVKQLLAGEDASFALEKRIFGGTASRFGPRRRRLRSAAPMGGSCLALGVVEDITDRKQAEEALQRQHQTLKHLLQSSDHERQLIAYEIHDGLAQQLAGAIMQFDAFDHLKKAKPKQAADAYHAGMTMLRQGHFEARRLIAGVRPPILDEEGIADAVGHLVNEHSPPQGAENRVPQPGRFRPPGPDLGKRRLPDCPRSPGERLPAQQERENIGRSLATRRSSSHRGP